jgi:CHAD domain-containing protein
MSAARKHPDGENYHAWRKRVKDHWYHVRLLNDIWSDAMTGYENSLKSLEDKLGTDHNLNVLAERVKTEPDFFGTTGQIDTLRELIDRYRKDLHEEAEAIGLRIYGEKPRDVERRLARWWREWQQVGKA